MRTATRGYKSKLRRREGALARLKNRVTSLPQLLVSRSHVREYKALLRKLGRS